MPCVLRCCCCCCAQGAVCTDVKKGTRAVGTNCSCPPNPATGAPLWGFPFGADPYVPRSAGFGNCFDETDASLQSLDFGRGVLGDFCPLVVVSTSASASPAEDVEDAGWVVYAPPRLASPPSPPPPATFLGRLFGSFVGRRSLSLSSSGDDEAPQPYEDALEDGSGSGSGDGPETISALACCAARTLEWRSQQYLNFTATPNRTDHASVRGVSPSGGIVPLTASSPTAQVTVASESSGVALLHSRP